MPVWKRKLQKGPSSDYATHVSLTVDVKLSKKHICAEEGYGFVQDIRVFAWILYRKTARGIQRHGRWIQGVANANLFAASRPRL